MSTIEIDEMIGDTLALVNVVRQAYDKPLLTELPDSKQGDSSDCLFYRALSEVGVKAVGSNSMDFGDERKAAYIAALWGTDSSGGTVTSPHQFTKVISDFDRGKLGHYSTSKRRNF